MAVAYAKAKPKHHVTDEKSQFQRFKDTARLLGSDETGRVFERAFAKIVPAKRSKRSGISPKPK
jgi:hypothetical protein